MAKIENIKIITEFESVGLKELQAQFDKLLASPKLNEQIKSEINTLFDHIKELGPKFKEQLAKGRITLKELGLDTLSKEAMDVFNNISEHLTGITFELPPQLEQEINDLNDQLDKLAMTKANAEQSIENIQVQKKQAKTKFGLRGAAADPDTMYAELSRLTTERTEAQAAADSKAVDKLNLKIKKQEEYIDTINKLNHSENGYLGKIAQVENKEAELNQQLIEKEKRREELIKSAEELGTEEGNLIKNIIQYIDSLKVESRAQNEVMQNQKKLVKATEQINDTDRKHSDTLGAKITKTLSYYTILNQLKKLLSDSIRTITELDKAMTEAAVVTEMNRKQAWALLGTYQELAKETGLATSQISGVVVEFLKQGRSINDAMKLAEVAAKSAKIAGISSQEAVDYLTSAVNGFGLAATQAEDIADKFAAIAASSATDFEELAIAMSKVSPTAKSAGVGVDFMMGVIAKGLETTREAPENIGTAFKTIFARMREVTDLGKATEDGMSLNRVEKALASVDVKLRDSTGQFRNLEDVLVDVGDKWDTLNSIEQAYLATALAGSRQQPRLLAIFNDFARTKELIQMSSDATGELNFQHMEYMEGMEAAMTNLKTAWEGFITTLADSSIIIGSIQIITSTIEALSSVVSFLGKNTFWSVTALTAMGAAMVFNAGRILYTIALKAIENRLMQRAIVLQTKLTADEAKELAVQLMFNGILKRKITLQRQELTTEQAQLISKGKLTAANSGLAVSEWGATVPLLIWVGIALAAVAVVGLLVWWYVEASKGISRYTDQIKKNNKEINDLKKSKDTVGGLIDKYKELNSLVSKTTEQQDELNSTIEQLQAFEVGDKTYDLTSVSTTGQIVFDEDKYQKMLKEIEATMAIKNAENITLINNAIKDNMEAAINNPELNDLAKQIGYNYAKGIIDGIEDSDLKGQVQNSVAKGLEGMDMSIFTGLVKKYSIAGLEFSSNTDLLAFFDQIKNVNFSSDWDTIFQQFLDIGLTRQEAWGARTTFLDKLNETGSTEKAKNALIFYLDSLVDVSESLGLNTTQLSAYTTALTNANIALASFSANSTNTADSIKSQYDAIDSQLTAVDALKNWTTAQKDALKQAIIDSNPEYSGLLSLQENGISFDVIANFKSGGKTYQDIYDLTNDLKSKLKDSEQDNVITIASQVYSGDSTFTDLKSALQKAGMSAEDISNMITTIFNELPSTSASAVAKTLNDSNATIKSFYDDQNDMVNGNFERYTEYALEYGKEFANAMSRGEADVLTVAKAEQTKLLIEIEKRRELVNQYVAANGQSQSANIELAQLLAEEQYVNTMTQAATLEKAEETLKKANNYLKIQQSLLNMGMDENSPFNIWLNKLIDGQYIDSLKELGDQLELDTQSLEQYGSFDKNGVFTFFADADAEQGKLALDNYFKTYSQYIETTSAEFERQKSQITSMYNEEIAALKEGNDERWKQIEYTDKLSDLEEKLIDSRRKLAGLSISSANSSSLNAATDELKKLQQERQKMIEQQMIAEAQKQLEAERDLKIQELGERQIDSMNALISSLDQLTMAISNDSGGTAERQFKTSANNNSQVYGLNGW